MLHVLGQFWLQLGRQNNCSVIYSAFFFPILLEFYNRLESHLLTLVLCLLGGRYVLSSVCCELGVYVGV